MPFQTIGSISSIEVFRTKNYPAGSKVFDPQILPDKYGSALVLVDVSQATDMSNVVTVDLELSFDSGATWNYAGGAGVDFSVAGYSISGGTVFDSDGEPVRICGSLISLPSKISVTRQLKGAVSIARPDIIGLTVALW